MMEKEKLEKYWSKTRCTVEQTLVLMDTFILNPSNAHFFFAYNKSKGKEISPKSALGTPRVKFIYLT